MKINSKVLALTSCFAFAVSIMAGEADIKINVKCSPELPVANLFAPYNCDFSKGLKGWAISKKSKESKNIEICDKKDSKEKYLYLKNNKGGIHRSFSNKLFELLEPKEFYIISCFVDADKDMNQKVGPFGGLGCSFTIYDKTWKKGQGRSAKTGYTGGKWQKTVSKVFTKPDWANHAQLHVNIGYSKGSGKVSEISLTKAYSTMSLDIKSDNNLSQVIVENEKGKMVFDSDELPENSKHYTCKVKVLTPYFYIIKVADTEGNVREIKYPETK